MANDKASPAVIVVTRIIEMPKAMTLEELIQRTLSDQNILEVIYRRKK